MTNVFMIKSDFPGWYAKTFLVSRMMFAEPGPVRESDTEFSSERNVTVPNPVMLL